MCIFANLNKLKFNLNHNTNNHKINLISINIIMKKIIYLLSMGIFMLSSCQDFDYGDLPTPIDEEAIRNATLALGVNIDTSHDWSTTESGSITITADADMEDIAKVQILTESPFFNADANILTEVKTAKGETVTLQYDAPKTYTRLLAACVSSKGEYFIKGFDVGTEQLAFSKSATRATVGADADGYPNMDNIQLEYKSSTPSYNARRTILANDASESDDEELKQFVNDNNLYLWEGKHWEKERLWGNTNGNRLELEDGWYFENNTVARVIDNIDEDEATALKDIFDTYLGRAKYNNNKRQDNMEALRNSPDVSINNNHMVSTGVAPIIITPVLMASSDLNSCNLYYYYYNPADIPSGMTEDEYMKQLPKFRAIMCHHTMAAAGINTNAGSENFFKKHEYLLPYYGEPNKLIGVEGEVKNMCKTDGKLYRIRNGQQLKGASYYMTYLNKTDKMSDKLVTKYDDNDEKVANQLWQIFTDPTGRVLLYNVGSQMYLCPDQEYTVMSTDVEKAKRNAYIMNDEGGYWRFWSHNSWDESQNSYTKCIGTDLTVKDSKRVSTNKVVNDGERSKWYLESYEGSKQIAAKEEFVHSTTPLVIKAESNVIPKGYRVGFMLRKMKGSQSEQDNLIAAATHNGCCYGDKRLNQEINQFPGHFGTALSQYSMTLDDPRMAMFQVNGNVYLTFEDGSDCNFSDFIIQVGGGIENSAYIPDIFGQVYTFCFEDRAKGDYDLNDVVIKAVRTDATHITYSVEACSGMDKVYLRNIHGKILNENTELHELFGVKGAVNGGTSHVDPIMETIEVDPTFSFYDLDKVLYIYNATTDTEIRLSETGEDPHAIMIPSDFQYPLEGTCVKDAYPAFLNWAKDRTQSLNWYIDPEVSSHVYKQSAFHFE